MSSSSPFGPTFRKIREARGLSLKEVAADIVSPQFLSQFERSQKGVTIETFSRLLLSMGVDWDTFLSHYPGLTIQNFSPILMKHINQENMDFLSIIERLKHEKSPVAEENKELWQLYLRSLEMQQFHETQVNLQEEANALQADIARSSRVSAVANVVTAYNTYRIHKDM